MNFASVPGHQDVKKRLRALVDEDRIPHALLLEGNEGSGKFMLARAFAKYIHCTNRSNGDSCGHCPSCRQIDSFNHLDTIYSFPVLKKNSKPTISDDWLEEFKTFVTEHPYMDFEEWLDSMNNKNGQPQIYAEEGMELLRRLTFRTRGSRFKTVLMWLPERLNEATANKLLKIVEEAFPDTIFIMTSDRPRAILGTIYSRTQRISVKNYSSEEISSILQENGYSHAIANEAALVAQGNINEALRVAADYGNENHELQLFAELMRKAYGRKVAELRKWSVQVAELGRESEIQFIDYCTRLMRESLIMHLSEQRLLTVNSAEATFLSKFFPFINEKNVLDLISLFDNARKDIAANANAKIVFFDLAVRTIILIRRK